MATAISIKDVVKEFPAAGGAGVVRAVDGISVEIEPGELFFLLGPSGCGKTTLLRMIAGFIEPTGGVVAFNGRDVTFLPPNKRNAGMVFQSYALWPHMTVEQNVAFGLTIRKVKGEARAARVREALEAVRMGEYGGRRPNQLSGGQQQRVALARALVIRPDVLLLDEPLSNLDAKLRVELRSEIRRVCKEAAITTVYVTHDQKEALSMADRVAVLDKGKVVQVGGARELYRRPRTKFVAEFLGETNFLPGRVVGRGGGRVVVETAVGRLEAADAEAGRSAPGVGAAATAGEASTPLPRPTGAGEEVLCSVRPEAWRVHGGGGGEAELGSHISDSKTQTADLKSQNSNLGSHSAEAGSRGARQGAGENLVSGRVVETVYLGEIAQYIVEAKGRRLRVAQMNPGGVGDARGEIALTVAAEDVVVLPAQGGACEEAR